MGRAIEFKQLIFVAKSMGHKQKAFQTDDMEIRYNCAKRYHVLYINCAKRYHVLYINCAKRYHVLYINCAKRIMRANKIWLDGMQMATENIVSGDI